MTKADVKFVEFGKDAVLKQKEVLATKTLRLYFPKSAPVKLYRTTDGRVGVQATLAVTPGDSKRVAEAYAAVMAAIGEGRGRPKGPATVQTKLRLENDVYIAVKKEAKRRRTTMSQVVADAVRAHVG